MQVNPTPLPPPLLEDCALRYAGKITEWNDERGFGFVVPNGGGDKAFVHISEWKQRSRRPVVGDPIVYSTSRDPHGRLQATGINFAAGKPAPRPPRSGFPRAIIGTLVLALVALAFFAHRLPLVIAATCFLSSLVSFLAYGMDKAAARKNAWRTPENTLHLIDLLGGWPGGLIAQQSFHHKTAKPSFQVGFWLSVAVNIAGVWWLVS